MNQKTLQLRITPLTQNTNRYVDRIEEELQNYFQVSEFKDLPIRIELSQELLNSKKDLSKINKNFSNASI